MEPNSNHQIKDHHGHQLFILVQREHGGQPGQMSSVHPASMIFLPLFHL
ncbi:hypothetical protein SORBI_3005G002050 [Sorghum bicolor]|uniref:Uncharacterized protein n=1 Tax=Sorghum bicolor TaxID=4558 RepID=A0A1Z5RFX0_SORBI|nr:hypothetical protein SORBI_3005G002050 [Sorghum bicolor]